MEVHARRRRRGYIWRDRRLRAAGVRRRDSRGLGSACIACIWLGVAQGRRGCRVHAGVRRVILLLGGLLLDLGDVRVVELGVLLLAGLAILVVGSGTSGTGYGTGYDADTGTSTTNIAAGNAIVVAVLGHGGLARRNAGTARGFRRTGSRRSAVGLALSAAEQEQDTGTDQGESGETTHDTTGNGARAALLFS